MSLQQDHEVCDALMSQIEDARHSVLMEGLFPSMKVETFVSRETFEAFQRANPWTHPCPGILFHSICATRVHIVNRPGIWFLTVIR